MPSNKIPRIFMTITSGKGHFEPLYSEKSAVEFLSQTEKC